MRYPFVAIEGPIGAGKTTLATKLAERVNANLLLEDFDNNAFLTDFYLDPERWSLPMQLSFLISRHNVSRRTAAILPKPLISDFSFAKERLFARLLLQKSREYELYSQISEALNHQYLVPDVVVLVDADDAVLLSRIADRGRLNERHINIEYLQKIRDAYITELKNANVIRIDSSRKGYSESSFFEELCVKIDDALPVGIERLKLRL
jgi:deoxyguanosine kinase